MTTTMVPVEGGAVHVLGTVHGLASEADVVRDAFARARPRVVALGLGAEGVAGLLAHVKRKENPEPVTPEELEESEGMDPYDYEAAELLTDAELAYGTALRGYGKVLLPPPDLIAAVRLAREADVPLFGVDLTEEQYSDAFSKHVTTFQLLRWSRRSRRLEKRPPKAATPREFALAWDAYLTKVKGYAALEREREARMAAHARELAKQHGVVLLVLEAAREPGVVAALRAPAPEA